MNSTCLEQYVGETYKDWSYRGRKPSGSVSLSSSTVPENSVPSSRPSPQPVHMLKPEQPVQQQPMAPMPFYADPTRFTAPVWQAEPAQTWPQGQFIQQIPAPSQPGLETYPPQQYPNGIYQATYQQPGFETNTFYTGAVQVLTNTRPPSAPDHSQLTPRTNGSYSHTPSPVPSQQSQQQGTPRSNISGQYHQDYNQGYVAPSTPTGNVDNSSRPSSVNSVVNAPTNNPSFQQSQQQQQSGNNFSSVSANNFSPGSNQNSNYVNANSGNEKPGYPQVNSNPQLVSHNSSGYPGNQYGGANIQQPQTQQQQQQQQTEQQTQQWPVSSENMMWEPNIIGQNTIGKPATIEHNDVAQYNQSDHPGDPGEYSQSNRVELNSRIKSMILNKHQNVGDRKHNDELQQQQQQQSQDNENKTGHFLWYSHHHRQTEFIGDGGGVPFQSPRNHVSPTLSSPIDKSRKEIYESANTKTLPQKNCNDHKDNDELLHCTSEGEDHSGPQLNENLKKHDVGPNEKALGNQKETIGLTAETTEDLKSKTTSTEIPFCTCFPPDKMPPEPGSYYTHLGCSNSLANLRKDYESRTGVSGKAIRIEKVRYAGKEGKSPQGCPLAKWILRRSSYDEKYLIIVKHREGHSCVSAYIVICMVAWEGVAKTEADSMYSTFTDKLNKFGLPTNRRCATNEQKTCACQGLDPKTCGASFSFGCSWSMYYNGCKYARSKIVRKFRLTERSEEQAVENRLQHLASFLAPLYKTLAPDSFKNQCLHEDEASDCRLGVKPGKPFSGVTACMDFCAHSHKDTHNMNDGCTMVVTLTKERRLTKHEEEQLHILPHYIMDSTDEFGSTDSQDAKIKAGSIEVLNKYECEVRIRTVPLQPCRRRKKKDEDNQTSPKKENTSGHSSTPSSGYESSGSQTPQTPLKNIDASLLQSNHVSSTVLDSPISSRSWMSNGYLDYHTEHNVNSWYSTSMMNGSNPDIIYYNASHHNSNNMKNSVLHKQKILTDNTAFPLTYPTHYNNNTNIHDSMRCRQTSQPAQINFTQNKVQDSHSGITRNTNQTVNNNNINYNFGMNCHNNTSNVNMNKIGEPYKFHNNNICSYPSDPVSSMLSLNSSHMSAFKVPLTPPESPIRHSGLHNYAGGVNQFGRIDNNNFFRPEGVNQFGVPPYVNQFQTNLQYNNGFNPNFDLPHQFLPHNITLPASVHDPAKGLYHYNQNTYSHQPKIKQSLPPFHFFNNNQYINPSTYHLCNPFDDIGDYGLKRTDSNPQAFDLAGGEIYTSPPWQHPKAWDFNSQTLPENTESLGKAIEVIDNAEAFMDSQVGGVAIALTHGSVMFECAKHELHCTTALKKPNRLAPTRISLVFYQHRNLNAAKHGWDQWEEKTRLRKLNCSDSNEENFDFDVLGEKMNLKALLEDNNGILMRAPALTTMSVATLLPMYPAS